MFAKDVWKGFFGNSICFKEDMSGSLPATYLFFPPCILVRSCNALFPSGQSRLRLLLSSILLSSFSSLFVSSKNSGCLLSYLITCSRYLAFFKLLVIVFLEIPSFSAFFLKDIIQSEKLFISAFTID